MGVGPSMYYVRPILATKLAFISFDLQLAEPPIVAQTEPADLVATEPPPLIYIRLVGYSPRSTSGIMPPAISML